jgi:hypothetical protein
MNFRLLQHWACLQDTIIGGMHEQDIKENPTIET